MLSWIHVVEWRAVVTPDEVALTDRHGTELTYAGLADEVDRAAARYAADGVRPGDVVALLARNSAAWAVALLGLVRAGALPAAVNWRLSAREIEALVELAGATAVVADDACTPLADGTHTVLPLPDLGGTSGQLAVPARPVGRLRGPEPCLLLHTSGTTGLPRLVPVTHQQLVASSVFMKLQVPEAQVGARHLSALPLFHAAGLANLAYVLFTGGRLHVLDAFDPASFVDELAERRIQLTQLVPTLIGLVTDEVRGRETAPDLSHLVEVVYGASPIDPLLLERAVRTLGCRFRQNYASTETGPLPISTLPPDAHDPTRGHLATAGRPSLGWEVRLGDLGEIQVRGATEFPGYWNDPDATRRALTADGFYRTGDVGDMDKDGYLTIVDRLGDLIVTGGENVYPAEVEPVLAAHPAVADVAVIGVPDARWGETVHAVVVLRPGADSGDLAAWARERLAAYKCPTGVTLADELPRNALGKLLRSRLREPYWAGRTRRVS